MQNIEEIGADLDSLKIARSINCDVEDITKHMKYNNHSINIISQNIRSINCNFDNFETLLQRTTMDWDTIVLTECWLTSAKGVKNIPGFNSSSTTRHNSQNEGVVIYHKKHLAASIEEPEVDDANCLILKIMSHTCIIGIYRPPRYHDITNFLNSLDNLLTKLKNFKNIILCGDINIDIHPESSGRRTHDYLNLLASHEMLPAHTLPTHSRTCLDHYIVRTKLKVICCVMNSSITDHDCVALNIDLKSKINMSNIPLTKLNLEALDIEISAINLEPIYSTTNTNDAARYLTSQLSNAISKSTTTRKPPKRKLIKKPWMTNGLLRCLKNRDNLHKKTKKEPNNDLLAITYKRYRSFCTSILKKTKRAYEKEEIEKAKKNPKHLWNVIKSISGRKNAEDHSMALLETGSELQNINQINRYYANTGKRLTENIAQLRMDNNSPSNHHHLVTPLNSFGMTITSEDEVKCIINGMKDKRSEDIYGISNHIVKRYSSILVSPITHICNLAITSGTFPDVFKTGLIRPIHKGSDKTCVDNYRPISVLPSLSKILERIINTRLVTFLETMKILAPTQYGFRKGTSTSSAVLDLVHAITTTLDAKKKSLVIFLDIARAFDSVSIPKLLLKLERVGVRGFPLDLFKSYLENRKQRVKIDTWTSEDANVTFGVPQGGVLSATMFLIYINDLCQMKLKEGKIFTYADDTALFFSGDTWAQTYRNAQIGLDAVNKWLKYNLLTLNTTKTKYIPFTMKNTYLPSRELSITAHTCTIAQSTNTCNCPAITRAETIKYLGVILDNTLSFKLHIETMASRLRKMIFIMKSLRNIADRKIIKTIYLALCHSIIEYCIVVWGGAAKSHLIVAERAQRALLKVAAKLPYRHPTQKVYQLWEILSVRRTFILRATLLKHSRTPFTSDTIKDKRRMGKIAKQQRHNTAFSQHFMTYLGPFLYKKLNNKLKIYLLNHHNCKKTLFKFLLPLDYETTENLIRPLK